MICYSEYKSFLIALLLLTFSLMSFSQKHPDPVCMQINNEAIKLSDVRKFSVQNNLSDPADSTVSTQCIHDFETYYLKLTEAKAQQVDKSSRFKKEMNEYRTQITAPYLISKMPDEQLIGREYDRLKQTHDISIILVPISSASNPANKRIIFPSDTLAAFEKAMALYRLCADSGYFDKTQNPYISQLMENVEALDLPMELENAVYKMNEGDISRPVRSRNGYYIVKIKAKKYYPEELPSLEKLKPGIISRLTQSAADWLLYEPALSKLKTQYDYSPCAESYSDLEKAVQCVYPKDNAFFSLFENDTKPLFTIEKQSIPISRFITFLKTNDRFRQTLSTELLTECLRKFEFEVLSEMEDQLVESNYPKLTTLLDQYKKDLLVLYITEKEVWNKTAANQLELKNYFENNRGKYFWEKPRYKGYIVHCKTIGERENIQKEIAAMDMDSAAVFLTQKYINDKTKPDIKISKKEILVQGRNEYVDELIFKTGKKGVPYLEYPRYFVFGNLLSQPEDYTDVISFIINDYQKQQEQEWLKTLREKYPVKVNPKIIHSITSDR